MDNELTGIPAVIFAAAVLAFFNTFAIRVVTGRNPIVHAGWNVYTGWVVTRHQDTAFTRALGYFVACVVFFVDPFLIAFVVGGVLNLVLGD